MHSIRASRARAATASVLLLASCGSGTAGILSGLGGSDDPTPTGSVVLGDLASEGGADRCPTSPAGFSFRLTDALARPSTVEVLVVPPGGSPFAASIDLDTSGLASSPAGVVHEFEWDFALDLGGAEYAEGYRLEARFAGATSGVQSSTFDVGNDPPDVASVTPPAVVATGTVAIDLELVDSASDPLALLVEWQDADLDSAWQSATLAGAAPQQLASSPTGTPHTLFWNSAADLPQVAANVRVRVRPADAWSLGAFRATNAFPIDNDSAPVVTAASSAGSTRVPPARIEFRLADAEVDPADVSVLVVPDAGAPFAAVLAPGSGTTGLDTDGSLLAVEWDFASQLVNGAGLTTGVRLRVQLVDGGHFLDTPDFDVGNDAPLVDGSTVPLTPTVGIVPVEVVVSDSSSDAIALGVEYAIVEDGLVWQPATLVGTSATSIAATPTGATTTVFWDASADVPGRTCTARLRLTPSDGDAVGTPAVTDPFSIDGNERPVAFVNGSAFFASADARRGLTLPFRVVDPEDDPVRVVFQWRTSGEAFPELPADAADLDAILSDPAARRALHIAERWTVETSGLAVPAGVDAIRAVGLARAFDDLVAHSPIGQDLEILRPLADPAPVAASWPSNPLVDPAAVLADGSGPAVLVLDRPAAGSWRLQRVDLATGASIDVLAQGFDGDPEALAAGAVEGEVIVATGAGGAWSVRRVVLATGATHALGAQGGLAPTGVVRGLVATGASNALVCVGDAIVAVDADLPTPAVVASGLAEPHGLALDPRRDGRVLFAERDWVDPLSALVTGRVAVLDLGTREVFTVVADGFALARPTCIASDPESARLVVLTDANTADGTRELREVLLSGSTGGASAQIASGIDADAAGLAVGADDLCVLVLPGSDLALRGGVEQVRAIAACDPSTRTITFTSPCDPALSTTRSWRMRFDATRAAVRPSHEQRFVWSSPEAAEVGNVLLRAVPYDARRGLSADTGLPRPVRAGIDVVPALLGGVASTSGATGVAAGDLDGDGALDLAVACPGSDRIALFFQASAGSFPSSPDATLAGIPILAPMTDPVAVRIVDVDGDGDLDLVSANAGSDNFSVCLQTVPGTFATQLLSLGLGVVDPVDVAVGDFNGDGRADFVTANAGSDNLTMFFQLLAGLYLPLPSLVLGGAGSTADPVAVEAGDLDGDGDLDVAVATAGSERVAVFLQSSPGVFPSSPSFTLGGPATTPDPGGLDLGDVDGDGRLDVAVACVGSGAVAVFLQSAGGVYASTPDLVLTSAGGPVGPRDVRLADLDGDGATDVLTVDVDGELTLFLRDPADGAFATRSIAIGTGSLSDPRQAVCGDFDSDGTVDVAVTDPDANGLALFLQRGGGAYSTSAPDATLGGASEIPGARGVAAADLDGDGDLDLAVAAPTSGRIAVYDQDGPATLGSAPRLVLGTDVTTAGVSAVAAADLDGDGRADLCAAATTGATLAIFPGLPDGSFDPTPAQQLGAGTLTGVGFVLAVDLDADGRTDLVSANPGAHDVAVFLQLAGGGFAVAPSQRLGSAIVTNGLVHVAAADVDGDGDLDLATANPGSNTVTVFLQSGAGAFGVVPTTTLSGAGTLGARAVVAADLNGDGRVDIACAASTSAAISAYLRTGAGTYPALPDVSLSNASLAGAVSLDLADLDGNGLTDFVAASSSSQRILAFRQVVHGTFADVPQLLGASVHTPSPSLAVVVDLDGDGDPDVISPQSSTSRLSVFFGSH